MSKLLASLQSLETESLDTINSSVIAITSQHMSCHVCDDEVENVTSLTFKISNSDGVKEFSLPPASDIELNQLALLFGVAHSLTQRVTFDAIPGFEISFIRDSESTVRVSFLADPQLLHFMGLENSCSLAHIVIALNELPVLEDTIRAASMLCK